MCIEAGLLRNQGVNMVASRAKLAEFQIFKLVENEEFIDYL